MKDTLKFSLSLIVFVLTLFITTDGNASSCISCQYIADDGRCTRDQDGTYICKAAFFAKTCLMGASSC